VALQLKSAGWTKARALIGGWEAVQASGLPLVAKELV
jgi:hypothetical protein